MSTNYTEHLGLTLWEPEDPVLRTEFNANNQKLDACLGSMPRIAAGSYEGTGDYGEDTPNALTFDFTPMMVIIVKNALSGIDQGTVMIRGQNKVPGIGCPSSATNSLSIRAEWKSNGLSWYTTTGASNQLNATGDTYCYFALGV